MNKPTFDELRDLAQRDPDAFELLRTDLIEDCIRSCSEINQQRLQGLKFVVETRQTLASSPMKALLDRQAMITVVN